MSYKIGTINNELWLFEGRVTGQLMSGLKFVTWEPLEKLRQPDKKKFLEWLLEDTRN